MQNVVINMCEKFDYNRWRNNGALGNREPDNKNKNKNNNYNVGSHWVQKPAQCTYILMRLLTNTK